MSAASVLIDFIDTSGSERTSSRLSPQPRIGHLAREVEDANPARTIVGRSRALRQVLEQIDDVASTDATVLITGESGTGKELLAKDEKAMDFGGEII